MTLTLEKDHYLNESKHRSLVTDTSDHVRINCNLIWHSDQVNLINCNKAPIITVWSLI